MLLFEKTLVRANETRSFLIQYAPSIGWESRETANQRIEQRQHTDWHHVERRVAIFAERVAALLGSGWRDAAGLSVSHDQGE